jgi:hypothetical protein
MQPVGSYCTDISQCTFNKTLNLLRYLLCSFFLPFIHSILSLPSVSLSFLPVSFLTPLLIRCYRSDLTFII